MKILCTCPSYFPGVSAVFRNMKAVVPIDFFYSDKEKLPENIEEYDLLIFGAWDPKTYPEIREIIRKKKNKAKLAVVWTSSTMQMELSPGDIEIKIFNILKIAIANQELDYLLIGDRNLAKALESDKVKHFPYPIEIKENFIERSPDANETNFLLFTVPHGRKNRINQTLAFDQALREDSRLNLHTNCIQENHPNIITYPWLSQEKYDELMKKIDFGLNVFPTESFCYSTVELMMRGIPTICSLRICNNLGFPLTLGDELVVFDVDDSQEIMRKIVKLKNNDPDFYKNLRQECRDHIVEFAQRNNENLKSLMQKLTL